MIAVGALSAVGCNNGGKPDDTPIGDDDDDDDGCEQTVYSTAEEWTEDKCLVEFQYSDECAEKFRGVRVSGEEHQPGWSYLQAPAACDPVNGQPTNYTGASVYAGWYAGGAYQCDDEDFTLSETPSLQCDGAFVADGTWQVTLPMPPSGDCDDYGELALTAYTTADCIDAITASAHPCSPDVDADVRLALRTWSDRALNGTEYARLSPVLVAGGDFSERAWMCKLTITDWGDADEVFVVRHGEAPRMTGNQVIDDAHVIKLTKVANSVTLDPGEATMGATILVSGLTTGEAFAGLRAEMSWSCHVNGSNPHYTVPATPQGYARRLRQLGITGIDDDQRLIARVWEDASLISIELQGRSRDAILTTATPDGADWLFDLNHVAHQIEAVGRIEPFEGEHKRIVFSKLIIRGVDLGTPSWALMALDET